MTQQQLQGARNSTGGPGVTNHQTESFALSLEGKFAPASLSPFCNLIFPIHEAQGTKNHNEL